MDVTKEHCTQAGPQTEAPRANIARNPALKPRRKRPSPSPPPQFRVTYHSRSLCGGGLRALSKALRAIFPEQFEKQRLTVMPLRQYRHDLTLPNGWKLWLDFYGDELSLALVPPEQGRLGAGLMISVPSKADPADVDEQADEYDDE